VRIGRSRYMRLIVVVAVVVTTIWISGANWGVVAVVALIVGLLGPPLIERLVQPTNTVKRPDAPESPMADTDGATSSTSPSPAATIGDHRRASTLGRVFGGGAIVVAVLGVLLLLSSGPKLLALDPTLKPASSPPVGSGTIRPTPLPTLAATTRPTPTPLRTSPATTSPTGSAVPTPPSPSDLPSTALPSPYAITETVRVEAHLTYDSQGTRWLVTQAWFVNEAAADRSEDALAGSSPTSSPSSLRQRWSQFGRSASEAGYIWEIRDGGVRVATARPREQKAKTVGDFESVEDVLLLQALQIGTVTMVPDASSSFACLYAPIGAIAKPSPDPQVSNCAGAAARVALHADSSGAIRIPVRVNGSFWRNELLVRAGDGMQLALGGTGGVVVAFAADAARRILMALFGGPAASLWKRFRKAKHSNPTKRRRR
jgi:hypothetical protein